MSTPEKKNRGDRLAKSLASEAGAVDQRFAHADSIFGGGKPTASEPAVKLVEKTVSAKDPQMEIIRDTFTLPKMDHDLIDLLSDRCLDERLRTTRAEILRAALNSLVKLSNKEIADAVRALPKTKVGKR